MNCVLCARRGRTRDAGEGHCCVTCAAHLQRQVADILRLAADAAAYVEPGSSAGGGSRPVPGSRPPLTVDALDPENTPVPVPNLPQHMWPTVLELCENWERLVRSERGMAPYGPVSHARALTVASRYPHTPVTLAGSVDFLGRQVAWMTVTPDFPLEDFATEIRACLRVLRRWDINAENQGQMVPCPTITDTGECGYRLHYQDLNDPVTCRRCGQTRDAATLALVAMSDGREVWLDPEAAARYLCISEGHLRKMAGRGRIQRSHGRYLVSNLDFTA